MKKKRIVGRPGLLGFTYYYDTSGKYVGKSRPGLLGDTRVFYNEKGRVGGVSRPGLFAERVYLDKESNQHVSVWPTLTGWSFFSGGQKKGHARKGFFGSEYISLDEDDDCIMEDEEWPG